MRILFNSQGIKAIALLPLYPRQSNSRTGGGEVNGMRRTLEFVKCSTLQLSSPLWENLQVPIINNLQGIPAMNVEAGEWAVESRRGSSIPIMGEPAGADHLEPAAWPISAPPSDGVPVIKFNVIISFRYISCHVIILIMVEVLSPWLQKEA